MKAGLSFSPSFSLGDTAPESGKPFKWFSRVGDSEDPKLKLGRMRKAAHNRLGKKQTVKDVMIMNNAVRTLGFSSKISLIHNSGTIPGFSLRSNPGLELANAFGVFN